MIQAKYFLYLPLRPVVFRFSRVQKQWDAGLTLITFNHFLIAFKLDNLPFFLACLLLSLATLVTCFYLRSIRGLNGLVVNALFFEAGGSRFESHACSNTLFTLESLAC